jgi:hypothetical protein
LVIGLASDIAGLYDKLELGWVISLLLLTIIVIWTWRLIKKQTQTWRGLINKADANLDFLGGTSKNKDGSIYSLQERLESINIIKSNLDELTELCQEHFNTTDKIASQEHWKNCPIEKCPNLHVLLYEVKELTSQMKEFKTQTEEYRSKNDISINSLVSRIDAMLIEVIAFLKALVMKNS